METDEKVLHLYYQLRLRLDGRVVKNNADHKSLMTVAKTKGLAAVELQSEDFTDICDCFHRKGLLGPSKLEILKMIFPASQNEAAYLDIVETERKISGIHHCSDDLPPQAKAPKTDAHEGDGKLDIDKIIQRAKFDAERKESGKIALGDGRTIDWSYRITFRGIQMKYKGSCIEPRTGSTGSATKQSRAGAVEHAMKDLFEKLKAKNSL